MRDILIVKNGVTIAELARRRGDYEAWITTGLGCGAERIRVVSVFEGEALPARATVAGVVVTGSSAMVSDRAPWSEATARWLREAVAAGTKVLGICYGHQLLAHALGGRVAKNPNGREIGSIELEPTAVASSDPLLDARAGRFRAQATHVECVLDLPPGATRLASTALDPNHAFRVGRAAWGVQFHPEFDADIVRAYLTARRPILETEGFDVDRILADVVEAPHANAVLRRFAGLLDD